jgi:superfamily II DNA/RNA helicase
VTVEEAKAERRELAAQVAGLVREFEERTGLRVAGIEVGHVVSPHEYRGERRDGVCAAVDVKVEL